MKTSLTLFTAAIALSFSANAIAADSYCLSKLKLAADVTKSVDEKKKEKITVVLKKDGKPQDPKLEGIIAEKAAIPPEGLKADAEVIAQVLENKNLKLTSGTAFKVDMAQDGTDAGLIIMAEYALEGGDAAFLVSDVVAGPLFVGTKKLCETKQ